jgi:ABC-type multidrug transport system permease subunit
VNTAEFSSSHYALQAANYTAFQFLFLKVTVKVTAKNIMLPWFAILSRISAIE